MTVSHTRARLPVLMVFALATSSCTSWRAARDPLPAPLDGQTLSQIRVLTRARGVIEVHQARLAGDSIVGFTLPRGDANAQRIAIATTEVAQVERRVGDLWKTFRMAIGVYLIAAAFLLAR